MSIPALTPSDFGGKFAGIQSYITSAALDLINRSETLREAIRRYQDDRKTADVVLDTSNKPSAATYRPPRRGCWERRLHHLRRRHPEQQHRSRARPLA